MAASTAKPSVHGRAVRALLAFVLLFAACKDNKDNKDAELPPALAALGALAAATPDHATGSLEAAGGNVTLADGAALVVTQGALADTVEIRLRRVDLKLEQLDVDAKASWAYVFETDRDVASFAAPVVLRIPRPRETVSVARWDGAQWQAVPLTADADATVQIEHFSGGVFSVLEWISGRTERTNRAILDEDDPSAKRRRTQVQHGNEALQRFLGVGEVYGGSRRALCDEIKQMVTNYPGATFDFPPSEGPYDDNRDLASFLHAGSAASVEGGRFWNMTASMIPVIEAKLLGQAAGVTPAGMLRICIEAAGGNVPRGVLACHNFLKDITYLGRDFTDRPSSTPMPDRFGEVARRLLTWRSEDTNPAGAYDKLGPLYHIFAAMTAGTWATSALGGHAAAAGEALLRAFRHGGDTPDPEKGEADDCGAAVADVIRSQPIAKPKAAADTGGEHESLTAADSAADGAEAGDSAAPATENLEWSGQWSGEARVAVSMDEIAKNYKETIELTATHTGSTVTLSRLQDGKKTEMPLTQTPSNPNAATGGGPTPNPTPVPGMEVTGTWKATAFLRPDGALYFTMASKITSRGRPSPELPEASSTLAFDMIAILQRKP